MFLFNTSKDGWFSTLLFLAIIMIIIIWFKRQDLSPFYEGFSQESPYIFKHGKTTYDEFYAEIYNQLMEPESVCKFQIEKIIEMTAPSIEKSSFLDIGSGTGEIAGQLSNKGYNTYAIDNSEAMTQYINKKYPGVQTKCSSVNQSMTYEKESFTHVICNGLTVYLFKNKQDFFRNSFFWLKSGGYLILHLVDPTKFDTIVPGGKPKLLDNPQQYSESRITDTAIDFIDFKYRGKYDFEKDNKVTFKETFTDDLTKNVRQQETQYYMNSMEEILKIASHNGFIPHAQINLSECCGDTHQYLVILERTQ
jgi:SAM-dependent methyltransferase